jgi:Ca2+-transporting ATPase
MISGSKIADGVGEYLVVAVGRKSFNGRLMMSLQGEAEATPLQVKLNRLADRIAQFGGGAGALLFTALMIKFFVQLKTNPGR